MAARTPYEAAANYKDHIQLLVSCVTRSVVRVAGAIFEGAPRPYRLELNNSLPVPLGGGSNLMFKLQQFFRIEGAGGEYRVNLVGYHYALHDDKRREILVYHWHPSGGSLVTTPHLHLEHGARVGYTLILGAHLPTGYVAVADLTRLLIRDLGVAPSRPDWDSLLSENPDPVPAP